MVSDSPAVANGVVYFKTESSTASDNYLYALNATTGSQLWSYAAGAILGDGSPSVANGMVYFERGDWVCTFTGEIYAFGAN
jgi:outer membrane protein assembly factor BamB